MKILFVDDSEDYRIMLRLWLGKTNHEHVITKSVTEAKEILLSQNFDLIICDLLMPEFSGIMMLEHIEKSQIKTPIAIVSVLEEMDYPHNYNIENRYVKPTNWSGLENIINIIVNKFNLLKNN